MIWPFHQNMTNPRKNYRSRISKGYPRIPSSISVKIIIKDLYTRMINLNIFLNSGSSISAHGPKANPDTESMFKTGYSGILLKKKDMPKISDPDQINGLMT